MLHVLGCHVTPGDACGMQELALRWSTPQHLRSCVVLRPNASLMDFLQTHCCRPALDPGYLGIASPNAQQPSEASIAGLAITTMEQMYGVCEAWQIQDLRQLEVLPWMGPWPLACAWGLGCQGSPGRPRIDAA